MQDNINLIKDKLAAYEQELEDEDSILMLQCVYVRDIQTLMEEITALTSRIEEQEKKASACSATADQAIDRITEQEKEIAGLRKERDLWKDAYRVCDKDNDELREENANLSRLTAL